MATYGLLENPEEDELHKSRLLNIEEKPFKRITRRLFATDYLLSSVSNLPLTPPPESQNDKREADTTLTDAERQKELEQHRQFRTDVLLDFAAFESTIARIQFLLASNEKERERYATEKLKILDTAQSVRDSTAQLRLQLEEAQKTLAMRKTWDELTEKITSNRMLRPREDQNANLEKLSDEIAELEREKAQYAQTWTERREQFGRIVKEGQELRRLIRDEKEEVERREGMEEMDEGEERGEDGEVAAGSGPDGTSAAGTPAVEAAGSTPLHITSHSDRGDNVSGSLRVPGGRARSTSRSGSISRAPSQASVTVDTAVMEVDDPDEKEEGEEDEDSPVETMDML